MALAQSASAAAARRLLARTRSSTTTHATTSTPPMAPAKTITSVPMPPFDEAAFGAGAPVDMASTAGTIALNGAAVVRDAVPTTTFTPVMPASRSAVSILPSVTASRMRSSVALALSSVIVATVNVTSTFVC